MVAIVASLAAFVAGFGLPTLPAGFGGARSPKEDGEDHSGSRAWRDACSSTSLNVHSAEAKDVSPSTQQEPPDRHQGALKTRTSTSQKERPMKVRFDLAKNKVHYITPYALVDPLTPLPARRARADRGGDEDEHDMSDDEDLAWREKVTSVLGLRPLPWTFWVVPCIVCMMLRVLGVEIMCDLFAATFAEGVKLARI